jgi:hypothetical protein
MPVVKEPPVIGHVAAVVDDVDGARVRGEIRAFRPNR